MPGEIVDAFARLQRDHPHRRLIYQPASNTVVSAGDLSRSASDIARALISAKLPPGGVVGAALGNRPAAVASFLACLDLGHPLLPMDAGTTAPEMSSAARGLGAAAVLLSSGEGIEGFTRAQAIAERVTLAVADEMPDRQTLDAVVLKLTSGSTGLPRATLTREAELVCDSRTLIAAMGIARDVVQVAAIPLSHAYGFGNLLVPLLLQGTAVVMREGFVPHRLPADARAVGARLFPGVPYMFEHFTAHPPVDGWPPTLTHVLAAGARLERTTVERFHRLFAVKVHSFYGTSETGGICYDDSDQLVEEGTVGRALPGVEVSLLPHEGAAPGQGRIFVKGPAVARGYADENASQAFVDGGFLTGDIGSFDAAGVLQLTSRISAFVNVAGRKVHPDEIERVLRDFPDCTDARVLGMADAVRGEQLVAAVVIRGPRPSLVTLRQFCAARLAPYKIPRVIVYLDALPLTERGKTDRRALEATVHAMLQRESGTTLTPDT